MGCCAVGTCVDPNCYLCTVVAKIQPPDACGATLADGQTCILEKGHQEWQACRGRRSGNQKAKPKATRDGVADPLKKSHDPTWTPRKRVGPHR
jgi:hypothetical protein